MSGRRFFVGGSCWDCGHECNVWDDCPESAAPRPPLHDECSCYLAEGRKEAGDGLTDLSASCKKCAEGPDSKKRKLAERLEVVILADREHVEVSCPTHGVVFRFELAQRLEAYCELCGAGSTCRH